MVRFRRTQAAIEEATDEAIRRLTAGESLHAVANAMHVSTPAVTNWLTRRSLTLTDLRPILSQKGTHHANKRANKYACVICGNPAFRPGGTCGSQSCMRLLREARRGEYPRAEGTPPPSPKPDHTDPPVPLPNPRDPRLPPLGVLVSDSKYVYCHVCGKGVRSIGRHAIKAHALHPMEYREMHGLKRTQSLAHPAHAAEMRERHTAILDAARPAENPLHAASAAEQQEWRSQPRALQSRIAQSRRKRDARDRPT